MDQLDVSHPASAASGVGQNPSTARGIVPKYKLIALAFGPHLHRNAGPAPSYCTLTVRTAFTSSPRSFRTISSITYTPRGT